MKNKIIAILLSLAMIGSVSCSSPTQEDTTPVEVEEDTHEIRYLDESDFSLLYSYKTQPKHENTLDITYAEAQLLMITARCEGGTSLEGQLWTMRTILNRVDDTEGDFKDITSIGQAIYQKGQFTVVNSKWFVKGILNENSHIALSMIESGWNESEGALYWESSSNSDSSWHKKNLTFIKEVEGNLFYK